MNIKEFINNTAPNKDDYLIEIISNNILNFYTIPERAYHNIDHVNECLKEFDNKPKDNLNDAQQNIIRYSLLYHDCIHFPKFKNNEIFSSNIAYVNLITLGFDDNFASQVCNAIRFTCHKCSTDYKIYQIVMDIDLSILGKDPEIFTGYENLIKLEYDFVNMEDYKKGRIKVLNSFLSKKHIYHTSYYRDKYEKQAIKNITELIRNLNK